jgi:hypothetical protein
MNGWVRYFGYRCDFLEGGSKGILRDLQGGNESFSLFLKGEFNGGVNDRHFEIFG